MAWNKTKLANHIEAARLLDKIKNDTFKYIKDNPKTKEYEVQKYILRKKYKSYQLVVQDFSSLGFATFFRRCNGHS